MSLVVLLFFSSFAGLRSGQLKMKAPSSRGKNDGSGKKMALLQFATRAWKEEGRFWVRERRVSPAMGVAGLPACSHFFFFVSVVY